MDYKTTLNLPQTDFPMKAQLAEREPNMLKRWQSIDLYKKMRQQGDSQPKFILHDGPPYANARPHMGTALNKTVKDIINKSKGFSGFDTPFVPGWDCHGLPIELKIENKFGKVGQKLDAKAFRQKCREFAASQVELQKADFIRMGVLADWDNPYLTMDPKFEANVVRALAKMMANGHLVRGQKPIYWSPLGHSASADTEVEYKDKESNAIDVAFNVVDADDFAVRINYSAAAGLIAIPIWTTTPWTLPANQAVALNAELDYALVSCDVAGQAWQLVLAKDLVASVMTRFGVEAYAIQASFKGEALEGLALQHPFADRQVPVVLGEHVTTDAGTGNVHTAPAHGEDDYYLGKRYHLPIETPLSSRSVFIDDEPIVGGLHVYKADQPVIDALKERGQLLHHGKIVHSYPHCWRYKTPLIFRATPQWFISMSQNQLLEQAEAAANQTEWLPSWGKNRFMSMLSGRPDWCISRQRAWGTPITLLIHKDSGELHPDMVNLMTKIATRMDDAGLEAWYDIDLKDLIGDEADHYDKVLDVLDVWFDAGSTHFTVLDQRPDLHVPADLYFEGTDQHRGWFQTSLLTSVAIRGAAPFKTVLTHGYVVDKHGQKMSKSIGNTIAPSEIVDKYGADILRLWAASCDHTQEVAVGDEILKRMSDAYRRIRNTARFLLSNLYDFDPSKDLVAFDDMVALDRWAVQHALQLQQQIIKQYDHYQLQQVYQLILNFCTVEMGSFYLDIIKDRLYTVKADVLARRSAQSALYHILQAFCRWLAPILSFTAEEIWQHMPGQVGDSIFLTTWYEGFYGADNNSEIDWAWLMQVRDEVNKEIEQLRRDAKLGSALEANVTLFADETALAKLQPLQQELRFVLITSAASVKPMTEANDAKATAIAGVSVAIDVTSAEKCSRCWQRRDDVGQDQQHPGLCGRCVVNVDGDGEARVFA